MLWLLTTIVIVLLWAIARRLKRIERAIKTLRLSVEIPIYGEAPDPEPQQQPQAAANVVAFRK